MISILVQIGFIVGIIFNFSYYNKEIKRLTCIVEDQWKENDKLREAIREVYERFNLI